MNGIVKVFFIITLVTLPIFSYGFSPTDWDQFEISNPDTKSFLLQSHTDKSSKVIIADLIAPDGEILIKSNFGQASIIRVPVEFYTELTSKIRAGGTKYRASAIIGQHNYSKSFIGTWKVRFGIKTESMIKTNDWKVIESDQKTKKALTFNLVITEQSISEHKNLKTIISSVENFYSKYDITIKLNLITDYLLALNQSLDKWVFNIQEKTELKKPIYLLKKVNPSTTAPDISGYSGCLPAMVSNTPCAIALSYKDFVTIDQKRFIKVISHEIAHHLGLFHINDDYSPLGFNDDRIEDTSLDDDICNVMHKTSEVFDKIELTPGQLKALRNNPMLYQ